METWLSGRKRFFAKEVSLKRVPWVRIPSSPPFHLKWNARFSQSEVDSDEVRRSAAKMAQQSHRLRHPLAALSLIDSRFFVPQLELGCSAFKAVVDGFANSFRWAELHFNVLKVLLVEPL